MRGLLLPRWNRTSCPLDTILSQRMLVVITFVSDERLPWLALARVAEWIGRQRKTSSSVFPVMCGTYFYDINIILSSYLSTRVLLWWNSSCCLASLALLSTDTWVTYIGQCIDCILIRYLFFFIVWSIEVKVFFVSVLFRLLVFVLHISYSEIIVCIWQLSAVEWACLPVWNVLRLTRREVLLITFFIPVLTITKLRKNHHWAFIYSCVSLWFTQ